MNNSGCLLGDMSLLTQNAENQKNNKFWTLLYIKKGAGIYLLDGHLRGLSDGDLLFFPPGLDYSFSSHDLGDEYNINISASVLRFDEAWLDALLGVFHGLSEMVLNIRNMRSAMYVSGLKWMSLSSLMDEIDQCGAASQSCLVMKILEQISDSKDMLPLTSEVKGEEPVGERLTRIRRYIDCNVYRKITLDEIAGYAGMNRTYFCLFFKKHFKISLTEYINSRKVDIASAMLLQTEKPVADIAKECGFTTVNYFNRIFRNIMGISPGEYRNARKIC